MMGVSAQAQFNQSFASSDKKSETQISPIIINPAGLGEYKPFSPPGLRMRNAGRTLTILGGAMLIGGIAVFASAEESYYSTGYNSNTGNYEEGDPKAALGVVMIAGGLGMTIPGVILWSKGAKKYKRYLEQHEGETVSFNLNGNGASLCYRF
ncbi:hypothetical protein SAMN05660236_5121 [Ohtaekwangia koreensis]|uniref:Uncharacterized protein n=2 Tax=Ohtaekwangia koreensis TaxID=688867 RepID=A0A1T5MED7_9BACT|nr:hypothetical protein SAMN05660236_5121 [Ohtaekwangia koreensis]